MSDSHEVVIRFGRPFDIRIRGEFRDTTEITIPFDNRESALAASLEVTITVRPVHDAGGEDYRPVVAGEVVRTEADEQFAADLAAAAGAERARPAIPASRPDALRQSAREAHAKGRITTADLEDRLRRIAFMEQQDRDARAG
jgi:hypothetical protein